MTNKSKWISQLGGVVSLEYYFGSFSIGLSGGYWHNTNYRSMVGSINVGLVF